MSENKIEYLYFSEDIEEKNWIKASHENKIPVNQFLLYDAEDSPLLKYLNIKNIPQYIFLDKDHKIKDFNAPKPRPENLHDFIEIVKKFCTGDK